MREWQSSLAYGFAFSTGIRFFRIERKKTNDRYLYRGLKKKKKNDRERERAVDVNSLDMKKLTWVDSFNMKPMAEADHDHRRHLVVLEIT